jgi:uncharacterized MAPEG superfamily protein
MNTTLSIVVYMGILTWLTLLVASLIRAQAWTPQGLMVAFGNRENLPPATGLAGRADRTARNTAESFMLFAALALVAQAAGASDKVAMGAQIFFWSRLVYIPVYYAGIVFLRTAVWTAGVVGMGMMVVAIM